MADLVLVSKGNPGKKFTTGQKMTDQVAADARVLLQALLSIDDLDRQEVNAAVRLGLAIDYFYNRQAMSNQYVAASLDAHGATNFASAKPRDCDHPYHQIIESPKQCVCRGWHVAVPPLIDGTAAWLTLGVDLSLRYFDRLNHSGWKTFVGKVQAFEEAKFSARSAAW